MRKMKLVRPAMGAVLAIAAALAGKQANADNIKVNLALPDTVLNLAWAYVAQAEGFWKDQGLDVEITVIQGLGAGQAVLAGDVQFSSGNAVTVLSSALHHIPLLAIASNTDTFVNSITISKEAAAKTGLTVATSTPVQRLKALKGMTIAIDQPNTNLDAFLKHAVVSVGLDPEKDITRTPIVSSAMLAAMEAHRIDGFSSQSPWSQLAEQHGTGVIWIAALRGDVADLKRAAGSGVNARADYCPKNPEICTKFINGLKLATDFILNNPDKATADIQPVYKNVAPELLKIGFAELRASSTKGNAFTEDMWAATQNVVLDAGLITKDQMLTKFEGVTYSNAWNK